MVGLAGLVTSSMAKADDAPATTPAAPPAAGAPADPTAAPPTTAATGTAAAGADQSKMRLGLTLVPAPLGSLKSATTSQDTAFAFGVMPLFDFKVHPNFFVGIAPLYTFNVKPSAQTAGDSSAELDIMLRVGGGLPVADKIQVYGYLSPGYSIVMLPQAAKDLGASDPKGFMLGFHAGGMMDVLPNVFVNAEVGYQLGFQSASFMGVSGDSKSNFLQIGLGGGIKL
jgi:hypothetical protein